MRESQDADENRLSSYPRKSRDKQINQVNGIGCADSGATHSIPGKGLCKILQKQGMKFIKESFSMAFADAHFSNAQVLTTQLIVKIKNRVVRTQFITLPESKGNRILLSLDFSGFKRIS
ncbi:hypothetical protein AVEN_32168-1 [Araneus ventricosus]|uniref:Uncharacterized protein n=1 Tax=Araneus ventricosus TaxID=182803 RepID=A0A4Y2VNL2_ARAVE|nr:hypothetical protein AVEN_32168-1 [Araneus ventricosus]